MYDYGYDYGIASILGGFAAMIGIISIVSLVVGIITIVSQWIIFKKAGKNGWESIVPIYNFIVLIQIVELPMWYIALFFVPFANIYAMFKIYIELAHKFGKSTGFGVATAFFSFVCLPILAFGKNNVYNGTNGGQPVTNNMQPEQNNSIPTVSFPNENNNMAYNNSESQTPFMFNQNINTEINPIQNSNPQVNQMPQPEMNPTPVFNPTTPLVNPQPEVNVVTNTQVPLQPAENQTINSMNNQVNQMQGVVTSQENTFKYETPTPVATPQPEIITQNGFVTGNQNVEPVPPQPQVNVIPGMGITPQPEVPNQNTGNNQPM